MDRILAESETRRPSDFALALKSILAFWLLYMTLITLRAIVLQFPQFWEMLARRAVATLIGAAVTFLVYLVLRRWTDENKELETLPDIVEDARSSLDLAGTGDTATVVASITDAGGYAIPEPGLTWSSDDEGVARVNDEGVVTASGPGSTTLTVDGESGGAVIRLR